MCELFGLSGKKRIAVNIPLKKFFSHSEVHSHGWGMSIFYGNSASLEKEPEKAIVSNYLHHRLANDVVADNMIAHIRLASRGTISYPNCHPFIKHDRSGTIWTLAHNGTIFNPEAASRLEEGRSIDDFKTIQEGQTDSERVLLFIVDYLNKKIGEGNKPLSIEQRIAYIEEALSALSDGNKLNILLWDGERLYVHTNYADTLYMKSLPESGSVMIATKPLDDTPWEHVPFLRLLVFEKGELIYEGVPLSKEYVEEIKNHEYKDIDYSNL